MEESQEPDAPGEELTGVASVDAVIRSLDRLETLPLAEHVAFFEEAHAGLRAALDAPPAAGLPADLPRPDLGDRAGA